jgi:putative ABC transport system permease protein
MFARLVASSLRARRGRMALSLIAVTLGVAVSTTLATLALQVGDDLARTLRASGPNFVVLPSGARLASEVEGADRSPALAGFALSDTMVGDLKRSFWKNNLLEAAPELTTSVTIDGHAETLAGTWFERDVAAADGEMWHTGIAGLHPTWKLEGRWPNDGADELILGARLAARVDRHPGARLRVRAGDAEHEWLVTGVLSAGGRDDDRAWTSLARAQAITGRAGEVDRLWLSALCKPSPRTPPPDPGRDPAGYERYRCAAYPDNVAHDLEQRLPGAEVLPLRELLRGESRVVSRLNMLMLLLALGAVTASVLGLVSTATATVIERRVELGLLRALGATSSQIGALLIGETVVVSLAGGLLGFLLGVAGAAAIRGDIFGTSAPFPVLLLPLALVLSLVLAVAGTLGPLKLALRTDPAQVLRG